MQLLSLRIREFGGLRDVSYDFSDGLNLIFGRNESGKSTLLAFIRFLLYGFPKRAAGEALSDGERAFSWENGVADGSLTLEKNGTIYRIERREQMKSTRKFLQIIDESTGLPVLKGEIPGEALLGIPLSVFDSTCCIRQLRSTRLDESGLAAAIENLILTGDESVSADKALSSLDEVRKLLLYKNGKGGEIYRLERTLAEREHELLSIRSDAEALSALKRDMEDLEKQILRESDAVREAEIACRCAEASTLLKRFDAKRQEETQRDLVKKELLEKRKAIEINGALPHETFIRALRDHARELELTEREVIRTEAELRGAERMEAGNPALLATAEKIRLHGGKMSILATLKHRKDLSLQYRKRFTPCLITAIVLALSGAGLSMLHPIFFLLLLGIGLVPLGNHFRTLSRREEAQYHTLLSEIAYPEDADPSLPAISGYLESTLREEARSAERTLHVSAAQERYSAAQEAAELARKDASLIAKRAGFTSVSPDALRNAAEEISHSLAEIARTEQLLSLYEGNCVRLSTELASYDESALMQTATAYASSTIAPSPEKCRVELRNLQDALRASEDRRPALISRISALEATMGSPDAVEAEIALIKTELHEKREKLRSVLLAADAITRARESLKARTSPRLRERAGEIVSHLTGGRYSTLAVSPQFELSTEENGRVHPADAFSGGTRDVIYLALRLAFTDLLSGNDPLPIFLDEALAQLDDTRASALLRLFTERAASGGQVLLFTCHTREEALLQSVPFRSISLS